MIYIIYHDADMDGICSGAILHQAMGGILLPHDYGRDFDLNQIESGSRVIMADVSLPYDQMKWLNEHTNFIWIDHHISAIKEMKNLNIAGHRDTKRAACELCWTFCYETPMPRAVCLLGRYDVWDHSADPNILAFQYGIRMQEYDPTACYWERLLGPPEISEPMVEKMITNGEILLSYESAQNAEKIKKLARPLNFAGLRFICANAPMTGSKIFDSVMDYDKYDAMLTWYINSDNKARVSMYTEKEGLDLSLIAKHFGGGGHPGACGFEPKHILLWDILGGERYEATEV